jgi:hypothetical protein
MKKETKMKPRTLISLFALALAASSSACTAETQPQASSDEPTATTEQAQIAALGNIMAWPAGPVVWNGLNAMWPINVWSPAAIGGLAFDIAGMTNFGITVAGFPNMFPVTITTPFLNAFVPPVGTFAPGAWATPFFGAAGLNAPAFGFTGAFAPFATGLGFGFGSVAPFGALNATWLNGGLAAGFGLWAPTLTANALMFNNLAVLNTFTPWTFNLTFTAQAAAQQTAFMAQSAAISTAALSVFATPIMPAAIATAALPIPFMSMAWPIMPLPLAATAPLTGAALTTGAFL